MITALEQLRRPPADSLFCRSGDACDRRPAISMKQQDDFTGLFADSFASAMIEVREDGGRETGEANAPAPR